MPGDGVTSVVRSGGEGVDSAVHKACDPPPSPLREGPASDPGRVRTSLCGEVQCNLSGTRPSPARRHSSISCRVRYTTPVRTVSTDLVRPNRRRTLNKVSGDSTDLRGLWTMCRRPTGRDPVVIEKLNSNVSVVFGCLSTRR